MIFFRTAAGWLKYDKQSHTVYPCVKCSSFGKKSHILLAFCYLQKSLIRILQLPFLDLGFKVTTSVRNLMGTFQPALLCIMLMGLSNDFSIMPNDINIVIWVPCFCAKSSEQKTQEQLNSTLFPRHGLIALEMNNQAKNDCKCEQFTTYTICFMSGSFLVLELQG